MGLILALQGDLNFVMQMKTVSNSLKSDSYLKRTEKGDHIYPTPQLGQDMTQGQFLSGV